MNILKTQMNCFVVTIIFENILQLNLTSISCYALSLGRTYILCEHHQYTAFNCSFQNLNKNRMHLPMDVAAGKNINCPVDGSRTSWKPTGGIGIGTIDSTGSDA